MRETVLFNDWERLEKVDVAAMESLCSAAGSRYIQALLDAIRKGRQIGTIPAAAWLPLTFARGCVLQPGTVSVNTVTGDVTLSGTWRFAFASDGTPGQVEDWTGTLVIGNGWVSGQNRLVLLKPQWADTATASRMIGDPDTGVFTQTSIATRNRLTGLLATVVNVVPIGGWWADAIVALEAAGYRWLLWTDGQPAGTYELFSVLPPFYEEQDTPPARYPSSVSQVLWGLVSQIARIIDGSAPGLAPSGTANWLIAPQTSLASLAEDVAARSLKAACRLTQTPPYYTEGMGIDAVTKTDDSWWQITLTTDARWFSAQLVAQNNSDPHPDGPIYLRLWRQSATVVSVGVYYWNGTAWALIPSLGGAWTVDFLAFGSAT